MPIKWTPWFDVALHRRLEVLCVSFYMFCVIFLGPICAFTIIYLLVGHSKLFRNISKWLSIYMFHIEYLRVSEASIQESFV